MAAVAEGRFDGVGRCFGPDDPFCAFDLDDCRFDDGTPAPWAARLIDLFVSYVEITPSWNGFRIWCIGEKPGSRSGYRDEEKGIEVEIYDRTSKRYLCLTGNAVNGSKIEPRQKEINFVYKKLFEPKQEPPAAHEQTQTGGDFFQWDGIIDHLPIRAEVKDMIKNGQPVGQRSEAIMTVLNSLVWSNLDDGEIVQILESEAIGEKYREKGASRHKWLEPQIAKARALVTDRAQPSRRTNDDPGPVEECLREPGDESEDEGKQTSTGPPARESMIITPFELAVARLTPPCIVKNYLFCDVGVMVAPGGTGKTTLILYEMACIALNRPLYGLDICRPGWCLYVTAEDSREILVARLREITSAMELTDTERQIVMGRVLIWDVTGMQKKLVTLRDSNVELTNLADDIIKTYIIDPPVLSVFDPVVSFGASESLVNDNEQGLITAGRRIVRGLGCCVRFVAHTGKANARGKTLDQYSSRGGSALPDGTRMTAVMQSWQPDDDRKLPAGLNYSPESSITFLARPKLSYAPPNLPLIWIKRTGWNFEHMTEIPVSDEQREKALFDQIERFIHSEVRACHYHSKKSLEESMMSFGVPRKSVRGAIERLMAYGRIIMDELPTEKQQGAWKTYLNISNVAGNQKTGGEIG
jgi:RecA-family ATPase